MLNAISKVLLALGVISVALGLGLHEYFMRTQRLHIEGLMGGGVTWGLAFILVGAIYAITQRTLAKILMVSLMALANAGLIAALWILSTESPNYPVYWDYLFYIKWIFLPPWLIINTAGSYYLVKAKK